MGFEQFVEGVECGIEVKRSFHQVFVFFPLYLIAVGIKEKYDVFYLASLYDVEDIGVYFLVLAFVVLYAANA